MPERPSKPVPEKGSAAEPLAVMEGRVAEPHSSSDLPDPIHSDVAKPRLRREWLLLGVSLLLLMAIIAPPLANLGRYQHRIVDTISRSLGREVTMRAVSLRLLPLPGLVITDMVVNEESGFGAEPALRAPTVVAQLRLASLWRGRFEVSRVEISEASLNLVRNSEGRWNVGSVLLQASHVANAPTGQRRAGPAPRFPYIEITDSRVNIKQGAEKLPYSLLNANLSMWLAEPDVWQIRLDGQPVRTDIELGLSDTGLLRVEGSLHRATALGHMPLALHGDWANAPLGQASRLLLGRDPGWRGDLHANADVSGDLDNLAIKTHVAIANLHREEFTPPESFAVDARCHASYSRAAHSLRDVSCRWPVGDGLLLLTGSISAEPSGSASDRQATLALTAQQLPASFLVAAAGLTLSDFFPAFRLDGAMSGMLFYNFHEGSTPVYAGVLEASRLKLIAGGLHTPLEVSDARLAATTPAPGGESSLVLTMAPIDMGGSSPVVVSAQFTQQGFLLHAAGSALLARLEDAGRASHLMPAALASLAPQGAAEFDVTRTGAWLPGGEPPAVMPAAVALPQVRRSRHGRRDDRPSQPEIAATPVAGTSGSMRLHNASYRPRFLPGAVSLPLASATFTPGQIEWNAPAAVFREMPFQLTATYPLRCAVQSDCVAHFRASCAALDARGLVSALRITGEQGHLIDDIISRLNPDAARWPALEGTVHADAFSIGPLVLRNAEAALAISDGKVNLTALDAQALGGSLHGEGVITMSGEAPRYELSATLSRISAAAAGALFHENWGAGSMTVSSKLQLFGSQFAELVASAQGTFQSAWDRGGLGGVTPLGRFASWIGEGRIHDQKLTFTSGVLTMGQAVPLTVTGDIGFDRVLSLHLSPAEPAVASGSTENAASEADTQSVVVTGTLAKPTK